MWLYLPSTCFPCAPVSEASTSESGLLSQRLARSVSWREKLSQPPVWRRRLKTVPWMRHLSGPTYSRLTVALGAESWIASVRASRASHTASPADARDTMTNGHSGPSWSESWTKCDPPWSSSKTSLTLPGIFDPSENDFQAWVIESKDRSTSLRRMLELRRNESGFSSWLTPKTPSGGAQPNPSYRTGGGIRHKLEDQVANWPSPRAEDSESCGNHPKQTDSLNAEVRNWPTPTAKDMAQSGASDYPKTATRHTGTTLTDASRSWATPTSRDWDKWHLRAPGHHRQVNLSGQVANWLTPLAPRPHDNEDTAGKDLESENQKSLSRQAVNWQTPQTDSFRSRSGDRKDELGLDRQARGFRLLVQEPTPNGSQSSSPTPNLRQRSTLRLNPRFDSWLMGMPLGWTNFERLEMESYLCAWRSRLDGLLQRLDLRIGYRATDYVNRLGR